MAKTLNKLAERLTAGEPQVSGRLTIYPLFVSGDKKTGRRMPPVTKVFATSCSKRTSTGAPLK